MVRFKHRYLVLEAIQSRRKTGLSKDHVFDAIRQSLQENFGDFGSGLVMPTFQVKYWNADTNTAIIRVARDQFRLLWSAVTLVVMLAGEYASIRVTHVGGSMRSCYKSGAQFGMAELQVGVAVESEN